MKKIDNIEEAVVGLMVGSIFIYFLGCYIILSAPLCAVFWWLGGAQGHSKLWRRWGVPITICCLCAINKWSWLPLMSIIPFFGALTLGYGIPTFDEQGHCIDDGSPLGRFALWIVTGGKPVYMDKKTENILNWVVRGIVGEAIGLAMVSLAFISMPMWLVTSIGIMFLFPLIVTTVD